MPRCTKIDDLSYLLRLTIVSLLQQSILGTGSNLSVSQMWLRMTVQTVSQTPEFLHLSM